jgi:hypothetical protein
MFRAAAGHDADSGNLFYVGKPLHGQEGDAIALNAAAAHLDLTVALAVIALEGKNLIGFVAGALKHSGHPFLGGEDNGKTVGIAANPGIFEGGDNVTLSKKVLAFFQGTFENDPLIIGVLESTAGLFFVSQGPN